MRQVVIVGRAGLAALVALALSAAVGCVKAPTSPSTIPAYSQVDLAVGTGDEAVSGNVLTVHYTGWLYDPTKTDSKGLQFGTSRGGEAFALTLGVGAVIEGWEKGLLGMKAGGIRRLVIPPSLAYGTVRNGPIPGNAALVFEIEVLTIETE